ncbi:MAG: tetratricopeptide repeat protein [Alphaproteobacteria bacterium]|nr:tetratricopeptide repeat protein [Alphaproteobacteria bacterium]
MATAQKSSLETEKGYEEGYELTLDDALDLAKGHHMEGNLLLAERTYRDILNAVPDHYPTIHFLGVLLYQTGVLDEALYCFEKSVEAAPDEKECWNNFGAALTDAKRIEEGMRAYDKALSIDPNFLDALNNKTVALWTSGNSEEAEKISRNILKNTPDNLDAKGNLGIALSTTGKHEEAIEIWEELAKAAPESDKVWINWGNTLRDMGKFADSEEKCRKAIELNPENPEAHNNLGNALRDMGRPQEALEHYKIATDAKPDHHEAHANTAIALCDQHDYKEAAVAARYAIAFKQDSFQANSALSFALRQLGDYAQARAASIRAIKADPESAEAYLDLADVNLMSDFLNDAEAALEEALKREPDSPRAYRKLSDIKEKMGDHAGGLEAIEKAIEMAPDMPIMWISKAQLLQMENRMPEAFECIEQAVSLAPSWHLPYQVRAEMLITVNENEQAEKSARKAMELNKDIPGPYATLVSLRKIKDKDSDDYKALMRLKNEEKRWGLGGACVLNYALSDLYEQMKEYDLAFEHLQKANDYKRQTIPYDPETQNDIVSAVKHRFTKGFIDQMAKTGCDSDIPVFIVGMPRSGTTLTEQIISSHPNVFGAGELMDLAKAREDIGGLTEDNGKEIGERYIESIKKRDPSGKAKRITDKMPGNYMNIGLIASILPNAKIIHCGRNAGDTSLSCYKQNFASGQYWSYNLEELAAEYNRYEDVMNYWRETIPDRFLDIRYEDTVSDFENQARKLIEFIGLEWNDACLEPHKQKRTVLTASKAQVTQPVYKTSMEKWRRYEKHLQPLIENLNTKI